MCGTQDWNKTYFSNGEAKPCVLYMRKQKVILEIVNEDTYAISR